MPGFFEAMNNLPVPEEKIHKVTIAGKDVVVKLEKKLEVMRNGEDAYMWKDEKTFVLKPRPKVGIEYKQLHKTKEMGWKFYKGDPYYPMDVEQGGYIWQQELE